MSTDLENKENQMDGVITLTSKGTGYVRARGDKDQKNSIEISPNNLNRALHGDIVRILLHPIKPNFQRTGEVLKVISRAKAGFAGKLEKNRGGYFVIPSDPKMYKDIMIPERDTKGAIHGDKVFCVITKWDDPKRSPLGKIVEVLGKPGQNDAEMKAFALEKGFSPNFPEAVEKEAEKIKAEGIPNEEIKRRKDFRNTPTFTIDPDDAKDFDDALSVKKLDDGNFEIGIHIADVSYYVRPGSALDIEAAGRATSVYLVDRTISMLPEILSNDLCSLKPDEERLTFGAVFVMDKNGSIKSEWFGKTIIKSFKRFTYEEAGLVLKNQNGSYLEELNILNEIAKKLAEKRKEAGAISLDQEEVKFKLDANGVPISVYKKERGETNKLIEEFMLLANREVALYIEKISKEIDHVFVYRIHDVPDKEKTENLLLFLSQLGFKLKTKDGVIDSKDINTLLESLEGRPEKDVVHTAIIRSMAKAIYSTKNIGHYGLAFTHYTHFTSPIRRYPDVIVHRLLFDYLSGNKVGKDKWNQYEIISNFSSEREKNASDAERGSIKYKQVEYMSSRIGQEFEGVISGISEWGLYIEEKETKCEGMLRFKDLTDDTYELKEKEMSAVGKNKKKVYRIGDKLKIKVKNADLGKKIIDYVLA